MLRVTIDGFALRFPRTGIVNHLYNTILELTKRNGYDITVLLEDLNFSDPEIADFVRGSLKVRLVEPVEDSGRIARLKAQYRNRGLAVRLPTPREIARAVAPDDIYLATDWYHYPVPHARANALVYYDLTAKLYPKFHEYTNIVKETRKMRAASGFDHLIAISDSTKSDLIKYANVKEKVIDTCYMGTDGIYESPTWRPRREVLEKYGVDPSCRYVLSVCTIEPRKNIVGMLNAFRVFLDKNPQHSCVRLVLSGHKGWRNEKLSNFLESYPYRDRVDFVGYVDLNDMPSLYRHAEAFLFLSFYEGFGIPILEAMKSSCPVVSSNTSSMPEVLGDCGELVSPQVPEAAAAALARIFDAPAYADALRFSGFARSKRFTWAKHVDKLEDILQKL